ncbi:hypothetical protein ACJA25_02215 [Mycoplasmopsis hyopharyngis]|uniref:hypothetical protein n=1 Tax=Mycoplasmopsis hyopharyngis TaxID=29558 RepID=UPI0038734363
MKKFICPKIISSLSLISIPIIFTSSKCTTHQNDEKKHKDNVEHIQESDSLTQEIMKIKVQLKDKNIPVDKLTIKDLNFYDYDPWNFIVVEPKIKIIDKKGAILVIFRLKEIKANKTSQEIELKILISTPSIIEVLDDVEIVISEKVFIEKITNTDLHFKNLPSNYVVAYTKIEHQIDSNKVEISFAITNLTTNETSKEKTIYLNYNEFPIPQETLDELASSIKPILKNENVLLEDILKTPFDQAITFLKVHKRIKIIDKKMTKTKEKNCLNISFKIQDPYNLNVSKTIVTKLRVNDKNSGNLFPFGT